jgi:AcrR family transcriptional regulator
MARMKSKDARSVRDFTRSAVGRPRVLTLDEILDAAIDLGLTGLSMPALAAKLQIGTATLYNYVANRDELLHLAACKQVRRPALDDLGQDWRSILRSHAKRFFDLWTSEPHLMVQYMQGNIGADALVDYLESYLAAMRRRGFCTADANRMYLAINTIVFGAAVRARYLKSMSGKGRGHGAAVRQCLQERDPDELPNVRACPEFADDDRLDIFDEMLDRVIESLAAEFESDHRDRRESRKTAMPKKRRGLR